jgi:hypothetical protein
MTKGLGLRLRTPDCAHPIEHHQENDEPTLISCASFPASGISVTSRGLCRPVHLLDKVNFQKHCVYYYRL